MKFSSLLGKNLISLANAKELGTVYSCTVDNKLRKIHQIATIDNDENEGYIENKYVNVGSDVLYTINALADYEQMGIDFPFRSRVFNTDGKLLGVVADFEFDGNQIIELELTDNERIKTSEVVIASDNLVIVKGERVIRPLSNSKKREKTPISASFTEVKPYSKISQTLSENGAKKVNNQVSVDNDYSYEEENNYPATQDDSYQTAEDIKYELNDNQNTNNNALTQSRAKQTDVAIHEENFKNETITINKTNDAIIQPDIIFEESPRKLISGYQFLLGRKVIKNILQGGILLIPRNKTIDVDTVELARKYGKLVELTVSSIEK